MNPKYDNSIIEKILIRNARVEIDKAWETSKIRRGFIAGMTYAVAGLYMTSIGVQDPWLGAFVPTGGYLLSTFSLPALKSFWISRIHKS